MPPPAPESAMPRLLNCLLTTALVCAPVWGAEIQGSVTTSKGLAPQLGHVTLSALGGSAEDALRLGADGRFAIDLDPGIYHELLLTAVDHEGSAVLIPPLAADEKAELHVRLARTAFPDQIEHVSILGSWNGLSTRSATAMQRGSEGSFLLEATVEGDTAIYQLANVAENGHTVNGMHSDRYAYDGGGDYFSVLDVVDGKIRIVFDPQELEPDTTPPLTQFDAGHRWIGRVNALFRREQILHAMPPAEAEPALGAHLDSLLTIARTDPQLRAFAWAQWSARGPIGEDAQPAEVLAALPPSSPAWGLALRGMRRVIEASPDPAEQRRIGEAFVRESPLAAVRGTALVALVEAAESAGDRTLQVELFERLKKEHGDNPAFSYELARVDPDRPVQIGRALPEFEVSALDAEDRITNRSLRGSFVLVDFWATWCAPCRAEMPTLHKANETFSERNLRILSLSLDQSPAEVRTYRRGTWPMPWRHAFLVGGWKNKVVKAFDIRGIPFPVLIDPEGRVVATGSALRGDELSETLDRLLPRGG